METFRAYFVHMFTATGAVFSMLAMLAAAEGKWSLMFLWLGVAFAVARLAFWAGYHMAPPLRAFGFAATFYPTVLVALWALWRVVI